MAPLLVIPSCDVLTDDWKDVGHALRLNLINDVYLFLRLGVQGLRRENANPFLQEVTL